MTGRYTVLNDGTEYPEAECGYSEGVLWCFIPESANFAQVFMDFASPEKTQHIVFHFGEMQAEYDGFTDFRGAMKNSDGRISVQLRKGVD